MKVLQNIRQQTGDTIVEVVLALTVIAMVLGSASALASRSTRAMQTTQEHSVALRIAQSQLEFLKGYLPLVEADDLADPAHLLRNTAAGYCLIKEEISGEAKVKPYLATDANCKVDEASAPTTNDIHYQVKITPQYDVAEKSYGAKIVVQWITLSGSTDTVTLNYRTYQKLVSNFAINLKCPPGKIGTPPNCTAVTPASIMPAQKNFPAWNLYETAGTRKIQQFKVTGPSTSSLSLGSVTLTGPNHSSFSITANTCLNVTLAASQECTVTVAFAPATGGANNTHANAGKKEAILTVNNLTNPAQKFESSLEGMTYSSRLAPGDKLYPGQMIRSYNPACYNDAESCGYYLTVEGHTMGVRDVDDPDYNLWSIPTATRRLQLSQAGQPTTIAFAAMQPEGNLVLYTSSTTGSYSWATNVSGLACAPLSSCPYALYANSYVFFDYSGTTKLYYHMMSGGLGSLKTWWSE